MNRKTSDKVDIRNEPILKEIENLKREHPFWGYRRIWAYLVYVKELQVNKKRVYNIMKKNKLLVTKETRLRAKRTQMKGKPKPQKPNEVWGIDMTKIKTEIGWVYVHVVLDWYSKKIVGTSLSLTSKTQDWLSTLDQSLMLQFPEGVKGKNLKLVSDNGCQPTSEKFMKSCNTVGITQIFTSYNNPKGNADTERVIRTMKEELFWLHEWRSQKQIEEALEKWVNEYNFKYLHSSLGYKPPVWVEKHYKSKEVA